MAMVVKSRTIDDRSSPAVAEMWDFLAAFGIPSHPDDHDVPQVVMAIRSKGWEPTLTQESDPKGWRAEIRESRDANQSRTSIGRDPERMMALLEALRHALGWSTREVDQQAFDAQTRSLLGLTAAEFMEKWRKGELSTDDSRVAYLLVARPVGW